MDDVVEYGRDGETAALASLGPLGNPEMERVALARVERFATLLADPLVRDVPAWHRLTRHALAAAYRDCAALSLKSVRNPARPGSSD